MMVMMIMMMMLMMMMMMMMLLMMMVITMMVMLTLLMMLMMIMAMMIMMVTMTMVMMNTIYHYDEYSVAICPLQRTPRPLSPMPHAWSQLSWFGDKLKTSPTRNGTMVACTTRHQKVYATIYETPRTPQAMLTEDGAFNTCTELGTIKGDDVGKVGQLLLQICIYTSIELPIL